MTNKKTVDIIKELILAAGDSAAKEIVKENQRLKLENDQLRKRIRSLEMCEPRPCDGPLYDGWLIDDYFKKIHEEVKESEEAYKDYRTFLTDATYHHFMRELTDIKTVVTSLQEKAGCGRYQRRNYQFQVNKWNELRDNGKRFKDGEAGIFSGGAERW